MNSIGKPRRDFSNILLQLGFRLEDEDMRKRLDLNRYGDVYRTAIFAADDTEVQAAKAKLDFLSKRFPRAALDSFIAWYWIDELETAPNEEIQDQMQSWLCNTLVLPSRPEFDDYRNWATAQNLRVINY